MKIIALIGKKIGMTSLFIENVITPITIVKADKNYFLGMRDYKTKKSVAISAFPVENKTRQKKSLIKVFENASAPYCNEINEFELPGDIDSSEIAIGSEFGPSSEMTGLFVDIRSVSKGKGFQGAMKRWGFAGLPASHGVSVSHRSLGSTGQRTLPGKVWKGKKMPGQMGNKMKCVKNIIIIKVDQESGLLFLKGSIPGAENSTVYISNAKNYNTAGGSFSSTNGKSLKNGN